MDDGLYQCQVSASDGVPGIRSHAARLTVHVPPDPPVLSPAALNATAGVPVILVCESSGGRPAPEVSFRVIRSWMASALIITHLLLYYLSTIYFFAFSSIKSSHFLRSFAL